MKLVTLVVASLISALAHAGVSVEMAVTGSHQAHYNYYIEGPNLRVDHVADGKSVAFLLWRGKEQRLLFLNHGEKKYMEMTGAQIKQLAAKGREMMKLSKSMASKLPPEARKEFDKMEARMSAKREFKKGGTKKAGEWTCQQYTVVAGKEVMSELCTVPLEQLGVSRADFHAIDLMKPFYESMGPTGPGNMGMEWGADLAHGFPVETIHQGQNGNNTVTRVVKVAKASHPADYMNIPAGYKKAESPPLPGTSAPTTKKPKRK